MAKEVAKMRSLEETLMKFMIENKVSFKYGYKADKTKVDLLNAYSDLGYEDLLYEAHNQQIHYTKGDILTLFNNATSEEQAFGSYKKFKKILGGSQTHEDFHGENGDGNILHILSSKDLGKCISIILNDVSKPDAYKLLLQTVD